MPTRWEFDSEEQVKKFVGVIRNFLNYLLHHDVCPEFKDQIDAARNLCDRAPRELWNVITITSLLPGNFNMACSEVFGGMYQGMYTTNDAWMEGLEWIKPAGISPDLARKVFKIGVAANASDEMFASYKHQLSNKDCRVINVEETGFEVTSIINPSETAINLYGQQENADLKTLGKIEARTWRNPSDPDDDLTEEEEASLKANPPIPKIYEFWVEEEILKKCEIGMKFEATIQETNFGLTYLDTISRVHCSFYQITPNDFMEDWREIEKEWRPKKDNRWELAKKRDVEQNGEIDDDDNQHPNGDHAAPPTGETESAEGPERDQDNAPLDDEPEDLPVNRNYVAAGYDDDFEVTEQDAKNRGEGKDPDSKETQQVFGVEVREAGTELKEVGPNVHTVVQNNFDVKRVEEIE